MALARARLRDVGREKTTRDARAAASTATRGRARGDGARAAHARARTARDGDHDRGADDAHRARGATRAQEGDEGTHRHATEEASTERPKPRAGGVPDDGSGGGAGGDDGGVQVSASRARGGFGTLDGARERGGGRTRGGRRFARRVGFLRRARARRSAACQYEGLAFNATTTSGVLERASRRDSPRSSPIARALTR